MTGNLVVIGSAAVPKFFFVQLIPDGVPGIAVTLLVKKACLDFPVGQLVKIEGGIVQGIPNFVPILLLDDRLANHDIGLMFFRAAQKPVIKIAADVIVTIGKGDIGALGKIGTG